MSEQPLTESTEPSPASLRWWPDGAIVGGLVLVVIVSVCGTLNHYGLTYDEGWGLLRAGSAREWAGLLLRDPARALSDEAIRRYWSADIEREGTVLRDQQPGASRFFNGTVGYGVGLVAGAAFPERAGSALFLAGCVAALYLLLAGPWGRTAAAFAAAQLLLMPRIFAHAHLCALDTAVMSMMFASVALMYAAVRRGSVAFACLSGLAWGFAMNCKINALFVPLILAAWVLALHRRFALRAAGCLLGGGLVAYFLTWPWLWHDTLSRLGAYYGFHLGHYPVAVSYFGRVSGEQPWHYPAVMTAITTPVVAVALGLAGIVVAARCVWRRPDEADGPACRRRSQSALLLIGALLTIGFNSLPGAPKYNGVRLFLPFFPFLSALSAVALSELLRLISSRLGLSAGSLLTPTRARVGLACVLLLPALRSVVEVHPYQLSYYNALIGGVRGAVARGMEATYWGDTYVASAAFVAAHAVPGDTAWVDLPGCEWLVRQHLALAGATVRLTSGGEPGREASWAIVQNKASELGVASRALLASGPPAFTAELSGVPLNLVYGRESIARAREQMPPPRNEPIQGDER